MGNKPLFRYDLEYDGKKIAIEIAEKMPKFMKRMSHRKGCTVFTRQATEEEIDEYFNKVRY
jgi:hypothetical protein